MMGQVLTKLELDALKRAVASAENVEDCASLQDLINLIKTVEDAWIQRDRYQNLIDNVWSKFREMSKLIKDGMKG